MRHVTALLCAVGWLSPALLRATEAPAHHEHEAPHGGTLLVFGDEFAHLELVLNPETGELRAYVLDGAAERGVAVEEPALAIEALTVEGRDPFDMSLRATENVLTGEVVGRTSEFAGRSPGLRGVERFEGSLRQLDVKGRSFRNVRFRFPEGNEEPPGQNDTVHPEGDRPPVQEENHEPTHAHSP